MILIVLEAPTAREEEEGRELLGYHEVLQFESCKYKVAYLSPTPDGPDDPDALMRTLTSQAFHVVLAVGRPVLEWFVGAEHITELLRSRSSWDGYVYEWGDEILPYVPRPRDCRGVVACIDPDTVRRQAFRSMPRLQEAKRRALQLYWGTPIYRGSNLFYTEVHDWMTLCKTIREESSGTSTD